MKKIAPGFIFILFFFIGCKEKSSVEFRNLSGDQAKKAFETAQDIKAIGKPRIVISAVWDTLLKTPVTRHETMTQLQFLIPVDDDGNFVDTTTTVARKKWSGKTASAIIMSVCSYSCQRDTPDATCAGASGCTWDNQLKQCSPADCGSGCSILRQCTLETFGDIIYGVVAQ